jgi:hypothetical protein
MISESTFANKFTSFWNEALPNAKNYVRLINSGLTEATHGPLSMVARPKNTVLVNVIAFNLFRDYVNKAYPPDQISTRGFHESGLFDLALRKAIAYLSNFTYGYSVDLPLSNPEIEDIIKIAQILSIRYDCNHGVLQIDPEFDGCGYINRSFGDLHVGTKLVEIKSGERRFSSVDLRQVLIYLTLNHYSKAPLEIHSVELFNPRMGILFHTDVNDFCRNLSALHSLELFDEIQKFIVDNVFIESASF